MFKKKRLLVTLCRSLECHFCCSLLLKQVSKASPDSRGGEFSLPLNGRTRKEFLAIFILSQQPLNSMFLVFLMPDGGRGPVHVEHSTANVTFSIRLILISCFTSFLFFCLDLFYLFIFYTAGSY